MRKRTFAACVTFLLLLTTESHGRVTDNRLLASVPAQYRARLIERLKLYVESARRHQFGSLYDLYDANTLATDKRGVSRDEYVKESRAGEAKGTYVTLLEFTPKTVKPLQRQQGRYAIRGRAKEWSEEEGRVLIWSEDVTIEASLQNGEWYFTPLIVKGTVWL
jgi:hypothetical protein